METQSIEFALTPEWITAIAAVLSAFALLIIALFGTARIAGLSKQIRNASGQLEHSLTSQREQRTLEAVRRYETDPELRAAIKAIWEKTQQNTDYTLLDESDRFHIITLLNYYEGIAAGIEQGLYIEALVKDYLAHVLDKAVRALLRGESGNGWDAGQPIVEVDSYHSLLAVQQRWALESNQSLYEMLR